MRKETVKSVSTNEDSIEEDTSIHLDKDSEATSANNTSEDTLIESIKESSTLYDP
jgi:hypothetical protein